MPLTFTADDFTETNQPDRLTFTPDEFEPVERPQTSEGLPSFQTPRGIVPPTAEQLGQVDLENPPASEYAKALFDQEKPGSSLARGGLQPFGITPENIPSGKDIAAGVESITPGPVKPFVQAQAPLAVIPSSVSKLAVGVADWMTSPKGIEQLAALEIPVLDVAMAGKFAKQMIEGGALNAKDAWDALQKKDWQRFSDNVVGAAVNMLGGVGAAIGGASKARGYLRRPAVPPPIPPSIPEVPQPTTEGVPSALQKPEAEVVLPNVQPQPVVSAAEVPAEESPVGVREGATAEEGPTPSEVLLKPSKQSGTIPQEVLEAQRDWKKSEKRLRRAQRQDPPDLADAHEARDEAEIIFRELSKKHNLTEEQFDKLSQEATQTDTESLRLDEPTTTAENLRPSVDLPTGERAVAGPGEITHGDVLEKAGVDPESIPHEDPARAFTDVSTGERLTRDEAEKATGIEGTAEAGGLDSQDLPRAEEKPTSPEIEKLKSELSKWQKKLDKAHKNGRPPIVSRINEIQARIDALSAAPPVAKGKETPPPESKVPETLPDIEGALSIPVPDVTEQRARLKLLQQKRDVLNKEYAALDAGYKTLGGKILLQRGPKYMRGRVKQSAKASDKKAYGDLQNQMADLRRQMHALDDVGREDQRAVDNAIDAEVISNPKKSLLTRLDRKVRSMEGKAPQGLVDALRAESARVVREKYPDATPEEVARLQPEIERASYFHDDPWKDPQLPDLQLLRGQALDAALNKPDVPKHQFPEELKEKLDRFRRADRTYGGKIDVNAPVEKLTAKDLASLKREIESATKKIHSENAARVKREAEEKAAEEAKETELLDEAQKVADSAKRVGTAGGRTAKDVKNDLVGRLAKAITDLVDRAKVDLKPDDSGGYIASSEGAVAFGTIESEEGKFKVSVNRPGEKESFSVTVSTMPEAEMVLKGMAAEASGHSIIGVPGDGVYKLRNSGKSLLGVWRDARRLETGAGGGPVKYTTSGVSRSDAKQWMKEAASKEGLLTDEQKEAAKQKSGIGAFIKSDPGLGITPQAPEWLRNMAKTAGRKIEAIRKQIPARIRSRPERHVMDQTADAIDNMAGILGRQMSKNISIGTSDVADRAASAVIAAKFDRKNLPDLLAKAIKGKNVEAANAVRYAQANWSKSEHLARKGEAILDWQLSEENGHGINTLDRDNYLPGIYDTDMWMGKGRPYMISGGGGISTAFKKGKTYDSPFHAIEDGYVPKTLKLSELIEHRVKQGQRLINRVEWGDSLRNIVDPTDKKPIVESMITKKRAPGLPGYEVAPVGYVRKSVIPGVDIAVHEDYAKLFDALTGTSRVANFEPGGIPVGPALLETAGFIKHGLLLFDTFHVSRIGQKQLSLTGKAGYRKGLTLLDYSNRDLSDAIKAKEITQDMADYANTNRPRFNQLLKAGLNVGRIQENMYNSLARSIPGIGTMNKWVFEKMTRGAMAETGLIEFERVKKENPKLSDEQVAQKVSRDINQLFGNLGKQGIFKDPTFQDMARLVFLAPQWVESMARTELRGFKGATIDPIMAKQIPFIQARGSIGRSMRNGLVAYFVGTQLVNLYFRGQFTWKNQEKGHKLDAWIPDVTGKSKGFFLSPFAVFAELTHDLLRYSRSEPDIASAISRIAANKLSPFARAEEVLRTGRDWDRQKVIGSWERMKHAAWALAPTPIPLSAPIRAAGGAALYPGQTQRQLTASAGIKTEPAETAQNQIRDLAKTWMKDSPIPAVRARYERGLKEEFGDSDYKPLRTALIKGDYVQARRQLDALLETKTAKTILQTMRPISSQGSFRPFTGSKVMEVAFVKSLTPEERQLYKEARQERIELYRRFREMLKQPETNN